MFNENRFPCENASGSTFHQSRAIKIEVMQLQNTLVSWSRIAPKEVVSKEPSVTAWVDHDLAVAS